MPKLDFAPLGLEQFADSPISPAPPRQQRPLPGPPPLSCFQGAPVVGVPENGRCRNWTSLGLPLLTTGVACFLTVLSSLSEMGWLISPMLKTWPILDLCLVHYISWFKGRFNTSLIVRQVWASYWEAKTFKLHTFCRILTLSASSALLGAAGWPRPLPPPGLHFVLQIFASSM